MNERLLLLRITGLVVCVVVYFVAIGMIIESALSPL